MSSSNADIPSVFGSLMHSNKDVGREHEDELEGPESGFAGDSVVEEEPGTHGTETLLLNEARHACALR